MPGTEGDDDADSYSPESEEAGELWCPNCSALMYADATRCPSCGDHVTPGAKPSQGLPWWVWLGVILLLAAIAGSLLTF